MNQQITSKDRVRSSGTSCVLISFGTQSWNNLHDPRGGFLARIVTVHGVGQQFKGDAIIHREWWPALLSGLHLAGGDLTDERELTCPFYGHLFRKPGTLAIATHYGIEDIGAEEAELLRLLWEEAARAEPECVPSPEELAAAQTLGRVPKVMQRALNALAKSRFWENIAEGMLIGDLKQALQYMNDSDLREQALGTVLEKIGPDTRVLIGHSLGSVIAYEAAHRRTEDIISLITLGSPLGIRNVIFDKLHPPPDAMGVGKWPGNVRYWTNIAEKGDVVALEKKLAPFFPTGIKDVLVYNGSSAHHGERYLTTKEAGEAILQGL
jgi:hypothetical protein